MNKSVFCICTVCPDLTLTYVYFCACFSIIQNSAIPLHSKEILCILFGNMKIPSGAGTVLQTAPWLPKQVFKPEALVAEISFPPLVVDWRKVSLV